MTLQALVTALQGVVGGSLGFIMAPNFKSRAVSAAVFVITMLFALTMLYILGTAFKLMDSFNFFPDTRTPYAVVVYEQATISTANRYYPAPPWQRGCGTRIIIGGAGEEYLWGKALEAAGGSDAAEGDILFSRLFLTTATESGIQRVVYRVSAAVYDWVNSPDAGRALVELVSASIKMEGRHASYSTFCAAVVINLRWMVVWLRIS